MTVRLGVDSRQTLPNASLDTECGEVCPNGPKERRRGTYGESAARCVAQKSPRNKHALKMRDASMRGFIDALSLRYLSACGAPRGARRVPARDRADT